MSDNALPSWSDLLALVEHLETTDFEDFVVEMPGLTVRVSRHGLAEPAAATPTAATPTAATPTAVTEPAVTEPAVTEPAVTGQDAGDADRVDITAPIVGTFFRRPAPDQPPFVEVGDDVEVGMTAAVIEVMKMMVPVEASVAGRIVAVLAEDGEMVEADQPLFVIETSVVT